MKILITALSLFLLFIFSASYAWQDKKQGIHSFTGTWKGTSICLVKNPCHDEIVVYHISLKDSLLEIQMNKIVNGTEEEMGSKLFRYNKKTGQIENTEPRAVWKFSLKNDMIEGTLYYKNVLFRNIKVSRVKS